MSQSRDHGRRRRRRDADMDVYEADTASESSGLDGLPPEHRSPREDEAEPDQPERANENENDADLLVDTYHSFPAFEWLEAKQPQAPTREVAFHRLDQTRVDWDEDPEMVEGDVLQPFDKDYPSTGITGTGEYCYLCAQTGIRVHSDARTQIEALLAHEGEMDTRTMCDSVARYYAWLIQPFNDNKPWPAAEVYRHIQQHRVSHRSALVEAYQVNTAYNEMLKANALKRNNMGRTGPPSSTTVLMHLKLSDQRVKLARDFERVNSRK